MKEFKIGLKWKRQKRRDAMPFGWRKKNEGIITDELEQWVIEKVKKDNAAGKSLDEIAKGLMQLGIKPRKGGEWFGRRLVYTLLVNERLLEKMKERGWLSASQLGEYMKKQMPVSSSRVSYHIKEFKEVSDQSPMENGQRGMEAGKIITQALISAVKGKRERKRLMGETSDAPQNRDLRASQHGGTSPTQGGFDRNPETPSPDVCKLEDSP